MSTRSGKRIHSSFHENTLNIVAEHVVQSERKRKSRRFKENVEELSDSGMKPIKRPNYVSYPVTDDEAMSNSVNYKEEEAKQTRSLRKNALKEQNKATSSTEITEPVTEVFKPVRTTRRTRKFPENVEDAQENYNHVQVAVNGGVKSRKEKKKKKSVDTLEDGIAKKKSRKKGRKPKRSGSMVVEDIAPEKNTLNMNNISIDSFHSAAGSPDKNFGKCLTDITSLNKKDFKENVKITENYIPTGRQTRSLARRSLVNNLEDTCKNKVSLKRKSDFKDFEVNATENETATHLEEYDSLLTSIPKKPKTAINDSISKKNITLGFNEDFKDSTLVLGDLEQRKSAIKAVLNTTYNDPGCPRSDTVFDDDKNSTITKLQTPESKINTTFEKPNKSPVEMVCGGVNEKAAKNITFEKDDPLINSLTITLNTTYEKVADDAKLNPKRTQSSIINDTYDKDDILSHITSENTGSTSNLRKSTQKHSTEMDSTYDKIKESDTTFDTAKKLNTTFDKDSKSSLISSDNSNITLDKSETSRISITSDESKDNIVNSTPVLIESSMDETLLNTSKPVLKADAEMKSPVTSIVNTTAVTPLKREGTFTKDSSHIGETQINILKTPTRKMSLPSPGCTPFPNKSSSKPVLDVTRSLEKSRRSSLAEPLPRATKVMFCSPVNNPVVVAQQRRKVIKSNLKGSNKSFIFEDSGPERPAPRKRSFTLSDVEDARTKRNRFASGAQSPVRPARARTTSATAKLPVPGTTTKPSTPRKSETKISRTKLPNFAALHQREFAKMESLDECQERRARRAKQLLTPTGAVTVLERTSPRESIEGKKCNSKTSPNLENERVDHKDGAGEKGTKETKNFTKPTTPLKSLPTLKSLNPGYTRFGFKLNCDVNPFCINKNEKNDQTFSGRKVNTVKRDLTRPLKEIRSLKRQATLPSLNGTTSARDAGKQSVMREKCLTERRNRIRDESRTIIRGVRTNRRFELQMRMRNME